MEMKLTTEMMEKLIAAKSVEELMALTSELGFVLSEKDAKELFEELCTHANEVASDNLLERVGSALVKNSILGQKLDDDELDVVSGGRIKCWTNRYQGKCSENSAPGNGLCSWTFIVEKCSDTVEKGSSCWSGDYCTTFSTTYTKWVEEYYIGPA